LLSARAFSIAMRRSVSSNSAGTPSAFNALGLEAAICMARSLPSCSSPPTRSSKHTDFRAAMDVRNQLPLGFDTDEATNRHVFADLADQRRTRRLNRPIAQGSADNAATSAGFFR
jgi:hypothetical protein